MLRARARAGAVGSWELFLLCNHDDAWFSIQSEANGLYVRVEDGYEGIYEYMLRADASTLSTASAFYRTTGSVAWSAFWWSSTGLYVSAELGYGSDNYGMLRARSSGIGPWEQFIVAIH